MAGHMGTIRSTKGSYTLEAAVLLPFVILAVLSLGYFMKTEGMWEGCINGAVDESAVVASKASSPSEAAMTGIKVKRRIEHDEPDIDNVRIKGLRVLYPDGGEDSLISYDIEASEEMALPLAFGHEFEFSSGIKFRGFVGKENRGTPLGAEALERETDGDPVVIFAQSGEKYHSENCTYVKAAVRPEILTESLKRRYDACSICESGNFPAGSVVFCFSGSDTAYHAGTCRVIKRRTSVVDRGEAEKRGYRPCSKCGGG